MAEDDRGDCMEDDWGAFLGLFDGFSHVGREPWSSRGLIRAPFAAIFEWETACTGMFDGLKWTGVSLHTLQIRKLCTPLGYREGCRPGGRGGCPMFLAPPLSTAPQMVVGHRLVREFYHYKTSYCINI